MARDKAEKNAQKAVDKALKGLHPMTVVIMVAALLVGIVVGVVVALNLFSNDRFVLLGESNYSLDVGEAYTYTEEGVEAVCFGQDLSGEVVVETVLEKDGNGNYIIPTDKAGVYTITYTVDCYKYGVDGPNGQIKRIRVFTVNEVEEDGRNGG